MSFISTWCPKNSEALIEILLIIFLFISWRYECRAIKMDMVNIIRKVRNIRAYFLNFVNINKFPEK